MGPSIAVFVVRDAVVWDLQTGSIKVEIPCREVIEQCCLSLTDTHVALVTSSGRVLLYAVESDDDLPVAHIKQFQIQVTHRFDSDAI